MPIYEYICSAAKRSCSYCASGFELLQKASDQRLERCPRCGAPVEKLISAHSVGASRSGLDQRAKSAGFHKLERRGKGEYEKKY